MFGIDATEFIVLIVLAIIMFGPEKIPQMSRKAARIVVYLRDVANNAQTQLRDELGPEYANLNLTDLNPKTFVKKHLSNEIAAIEETKAELLAAGKQVKEASTDLKSSASDALHAKPEVALAGPAGPRFDLEAT